MAWVFGYIVCGLLTYFTAQDPTPEEIREMEHEHCDFNIKVTQADIEQAKIAEAIFWPFTLVCNIYLLFVGR